jgi:3-hydroxyacyl-[acyl-carrier-protein] dehydratase
MLADDFYKVLEISHIEENSIEAGILFNKEHSIFIGHFPEIPIVPGVTQIQIVKEILERELNEKLQLSQAKNIKHTGIITPIETLNVTVTIKYSFEENNSIKVNATIINEKGTFLKFSGVFKKK